MSILKTLIYLAVVAAFCFALGFTFMLLWAAYKDPDGERWPG